MNIKQTILSLSLVFLPICAMAQKITLGSCTTRDGGQYKGEMVSGKPNGKGNTVFANGDTYEGEYVKGRREGYGIYTFPTERNMKGSGFKTSSTARALIIS